jgi:hypothetical protein
MFSTELRMSDNTEMNIRVIIRPPRVRKPFFASSVSRAKPALPNIYTHTPVHRSLPRKMRYHPLAFIMLLPWVLITYLNFLSIFTEFFSTIFGEKSGIFSVGKLRRVAPGRTGIFRFSRCSHGRRAKAALKPMC